MKNSFQAKTGQIASQWYVIDATDQVVGRLAAQIAPILMGKHRPTYTPHVDTGDYIIVTNVDKVVFTGKKWDQKVYQRYTGHTGGLKEEAAWKLLQRKPERILYEAVRRMMPKSRLGHRMLDKLKLYAGSVHPHQAQQPIPLEPKSGRPAAAGILLAPEQVVNPPRRKRRAKPTDTEAAVATAPAEVETETAEAPSTEATAPETLTTEAAAPATEAATTEAPSPTTPEPEATEAPATEETKAEAETETETNPETPPSQG